MEKINAGITFMAKFVKPKSGIYLKYIEYMNREEAIRDKNFNKFNLFTEYMGNEEKSVGLFGNEGRLFTELEKEELKEKFVKASKDGSNMYQQIFSFDMNWLKKHGIYEEETKIINEDILRQYTSLAMNKMLEKENFGTAIWTGSVHHNTEHLHIHIAMVDEKVSWKKGEGRCKKNGDGKLYQRGKLKYQSINEGKEVFANLIMNSKELNMAISKTARTLISTKINKKEMEILKEKSVAKKFRNLIDILPKDTRLLKYNNNAMLKYRELIDEITTTLLENNFQKEYKDLKTLLQKQEENYKEAYGKEEKNPYMKNQIKELYARCGNSILSSAREIIKNERGDFYKKGQYRKERRSKKISIGEHEISKAMKMLNRAFSKNIETLKNQARYIQLQTDLERDRDF